MIGEKRQRIAYIVGDYLAANVAWIVYSALRFDMIQGSAGVAEIDDLYGFLTSGGTRLGILFFPIMMVVIAYLSGYYNQVFFKSRLQELSTTAMSTFIAAIIMFFSVLINDAFPERLINYELVLSMWACIFAALYITRFFITGRVVAKIESGKLKFRTLIIGNNAKTAEFIRQNNRKYKASGYHIEAIIRFGDEKAGSVVDGISVFPFSQIDRVCEMLSIDTIIITVNEIDKEQLFNLINNLFKYNVPIKIAPELCDILTTKVRHDNILTEPLIDIAQNDMPDSQKSIKRAIDIVASAFALTLLLPVFLIISILIKRDSKGPVIYKQERIGRHGKPFYIYKFRTMRNDAEKGNVPQLSSTDDPRVTRIGKFLRKYRLDETPQFWNVVKGDMSLVGTRTERRYFVDKIIERAPYFTLIYQVRPGITSLGMVKFGYATNIDEMITRTKYDIIYIENMSLLIDIKIIIYTIKTVFTGKGL